MADKNGMFEFFVSKDYLDPGSSDLELYLDFHNCCAKWYDASSGKLANGTRFTYELDDGYTDSKAVPYTP